MCLLCVARGGGGGGAHATEPRGLSGGGGGERRAAEAPLVQAHLTRAPRLPWNVADGRAWEPPPAARIYAEMVAELDTITTRFNEVPVDVEMNANRVTRVITQDRDNRGNLGKKQAYTGKVIIDATYEADLAEFAKSGKKAEHSSSADDSYKAATDKAAELPPTHPIRLGLSLQGGKTARRHPTPQPSPLPTLQPSPLPTLQPSPLPTPQPSPLPTPQPTAAPTPQPTALPTLQPSPLPTLQPSPVPTRQPSALPTRKSPGCETEVS